MMKLIRVLGVLLLGFLVVENSFGQGKLGLEVKAGTGNTEIDYVSTFPDLVVSTSDHVFFSLGLVKAFENGWAYGLEGEYYRFDTFFSYIPLDNGRNNGGVKHNFWAFGPKLQKDFLLSSNFGLSMATAFHLTLNTEDDYQFQGGELQTVRQPSGEPRVPVRLYGERTVESVNYLVKPEIGLFYDLNDKSRITLSGKYGLSLKDPSITIDLDQIEFEGDTFHNTYTNNGNFVSVLLGYRYSF